MKPNQPNLLHMVRQLERWGEMLAVLVAEAHAPDARPSPAHQQHLQNMKAKHDAVQSKLKDLITAMPLGMVPLGADVRGAWDQLDRTIRKLPT